jgi:GTP pyrophosphokinase
VNHKIESIFEPVKNGDQIEIITSDNSHPVIEWLDHVTTAKAKQAITSYLKKTNQNNVERGIQIFDNRMREFGITPSARLFRKLLPAYECSTKDEFYSKLGSEIINLDDVDKVLRQNSKRKVLKFWNVQLAKQPKSSSGVEDALMLDKKKNSKAAPTFVLAEKCNPIPGDEIIGYRDPETNTITVHKAGCEEITRLAAQHGENIVSDIKWSSYKSDSYLAEIEIRGIDRIGILMDVAEVITGELDINIRGMSVQSHDGIFEGKISVYVKDTENVQNILEKVGNVKGIELVKRVN